MVVSSWRNMSANPPSICFQLVSIQVQKTRKMTWEMMYAANAPTFSHSPVSVVCVFDEILKYISKKKHKLNIMSLYHPLPCEGFPKNDRSSD